MRAKTRQARGERAGRTPGTRSLILLGRLAVAVAEKGKGLGTGLLKDALLRAAQAAEIVGCRAVMVHAEDLAAKAFYERFGFEASPVDEPRLCLLMQKTSKRA